MRAALTLWRPATRRVGLVSKVRQRRWLDDDGVHVLRRWSQEHGALEPVRFLPGWIDETGQDRLMISIDQVGLAIHVRWPIGMRQHDSDEGPVRSYRGWTPPGRWRGIPIFSTLSTGSLAIALFVGVTAEDKDDRIQVPLLFLGVVAFFWLTLWLEGRARMVICGTCIGVTSAMTGRARQWCDLRTVEFMTLRGVRTKNVWNTSVVLWNKTPWPRFRGVSAKSALLGATQATRDAVTERVKHDPAYPLVIGYSKTGPACRRDVDRAMSESGKSFYR